MVRQPRLCQYGGVCKSGQSMPVHSAAMIQFSAMDPQKIIPNFSRGTLTHMLEGSRLPDHAVRLLYFTLLYFSLGSTGLPHSVYDAFIGLSLHVKDLEHMWQRSTHRAHSSSAYLAPVKGCPYRMPVPDMLPGASYSELPPSPQYGSKASLRTKHALLLPVCRFLRK